MSGIFATRYQAVKERRTNPFCDGAEKVVKVYGGYVLMDVEEYRVWKGTK